MTKIPVNFCIDSDLLAELRIHATQTGCTVIELIEQFCQQGLGKASESSVSALNNCINSNNLLTRVEIVETDVKSILERLSVLESKVDIDIDVDDYLQNWQKSLEPKIAFLVNTFVENRVEEILRLDRRPAEIEPSEQVAPASNTKPSLISTRSKGLPDDYQIDSEYDDEPDEILTDFLES